MSDEPDLYHPMSDFLMLVLDEDLGVDTSVDGITVSGRGVTSDPRLVWIGSLLR